MECVAETFGRTPRSATNITQVTAIYAWVYCHATPASPVPSTAEWMPVAVKLSDPPVVLETPDSGQSGLTFDEIFPPDVRTRANTDPTQLGSLIQQLPSTTRDTLLPTSS